MQSVLSTDIERRTQMRCGNNKGKRYFITLKSIEIIERRTQKISTVINHRETMREGKPNGIGNLCSFRNGGGGLKKGE